MPIRKMRAEEFAQRLRGADPEADKHFALFVGAGCSVSSGIPAAGKLVKDHWLPRLRDFRARECKDTEAWACKEIEGYDPNCPAASYGKVIEALFLEPEDRQREIERICDGKFPGFGYAVLANLIAQKSGRFNVVITTNFDDLVPDALYLYTKSRPLVVHHESLANYIRPTRTRPLVVKVHGDHRLTPYNTSAETRNINPELQAAIGGLLHDRGIIFMGYGGADEGIRNMIEALPPRALPFGVFWVSRSEPQNMLRNWLDARNAHWIENSDFDEMMLLIRDAFALEHPSQKRFEDVFARYMQTYQELSAKIAALPSDEPDASALKRAVDRTDETLTDWWAVEVAAKRCKETDVEQADTIYKDGIEKFPDSFELLGNYALFLYDYCKDYDRAEEFFKQAVEANPTHANTLNNYAVFLKQIRKDYDRTEEFYERAVEADPTHVNSLGNYAWFLGEIRKDYDRAEEFYERAVEANPTHVNTLNNYAVFLMDVRKDYDRAEEIYKRAIEADPTEAKSLGNYALFLYSIRRDYEKAEELYKRAAEADPSNADILGNYSQFLLATNRYDEAKPMVKKAAGLLNESGDLSLRVELWFYIYVHGLEGKDEALPELKRLLAEGARSPGWNLSPNVARAREDGHPQVEWLQKLADVISEKTDISVLDEWPEWNEIELPKEDT